MSGGMFLKKAGRDQLFINLSLRDADVSVFEKADNIVIDDLIQNDKGKALPIGEFLEKGDRTKVKELSYMLFGKGRDIRCEGLTILNTVGLAIEDIVLAYEIYKRIPKEDMLAIG